MNFTKLQGAGNDFVLLETDDAGRDWSQLAGAVCDRRFGVGGDGLLLMMPSKVADFRMRIFNADGSEAEACGNGLRCLVRYILERGLAAGKESGDMTIETMSGVRKARITTAGDGRVEIEVSLGRPAFGASDIPVVITPGSAGLIDIKSMIVYTVTAGDKKLPLNFVSMGNPHAVYFFDESVADFPLARLGPEIEHLKIFPQRTNFEVVRVLSREQLEARVWERGVGETLACGSGAAATAVAAQLNGLVGERVEIKLPGGILNVTWDRVGEVLLGGPARIVFTGNWSGEV
jgi:diaminopimelate epimerase